ncbi:MAG: ABC transporter ATP-binding protein [Candidatus Bipolaricaulota bacterium]
MIAIEGLHVDYVVDGGNQVIKDFNLRVKTDESLSIIGPSGCGKTTLLHAIAGLKEPTKGTIKVEPKGETALILQNIGLLPWKTVQENALLGVQIRGRSGRQRVKTLLKDLQIWEYRDRYPSHLSGGQKRRLGLVRALAVNPSVLLMDEPLVSLDEFIRERLQDVILRLWQKNELTMIMVTHNLEEAVFLGERIVVLTKQPANVSTILPNSGFGTVDYRRTEEFYSQVRNLREIVQ